MHLPCLGYASSASFLLRALVPSTRLTVSQLRYDHVLVETKSGQTPVTEFTGSMYEEVSQQRSVITPEFEDASTELKV